MFNPTSILGIISNLIGVCITSLITAYIQKQTEHSKLLIIHSESGRNIYRKRRFG